MVLNNSTNCIKDWPAISLKFCFAYQRNQSLIHKYNYTLAITLNIKIKLLLFFKICRVFRELKTYISPAFKSHKKKNRKKNYLQNLT